MVSRVSRINPLGNALVSGTSIICRSSSLLSRTRVGFQGFLEALFFCFAVIFTYISNPMLKDNIFAQIKKAPISGGCGCFHFGKSYRWRRDWLPAMMLLWLCEQFNHTERVLCPAIFASDYCLDRL